MPDEVVPQGAVAEPAAPAAPVAEPRNVREAIAARVAGGVPEIITTPDEVVEPAETDALDEFAAPAAPVEAPAIDAAAGAVDPFAAYGGKEAVDNAIAISEALRTESGARLIAAQTLHALGYDPDAIRAALEVKGASPAQAAEATAAVTEDDPLASLADDDMVTAADVRALVQRATEQTAAQVKAQLEAATQPLATQIEVERQARATSVTDGTLVELLGEPPTDQAELRNWQVNAQAVLEQAMIGFDQNQWDPAYIRQAVLRGHAAWQANEDRKLAAYVATKRAQRDAAPSHIGGAPIPSNEETPKEPRSVKEAIAMRKASGLR